MFNYMFSNPSEYNEILQFFTLFLLFVIGAMIYYMSENTESLEKKINELEISCPECPKCPKCPKLETPEGTECPQCPDCVCSETTDSEGHVINCPEHPPCPSCPDPPQCPTVDDIIAGIFPGRNTGITSGGRYFDIQASDSYELMPDYDYYQPMDAFPQDSILDPLHYGNARVPTNAIDNTNENYNMDTSSSTSLTDRMDMGLGGGIGENTGPVNRYRAPPGSSRFGSETERTTGNLSSVDRLIREARRDAEARGVPFTQEDIQRIRDEQAERDRLEGDMNDINTDTGDLNPNSPNTPNSGGE